MGKALEYFRFLIHIRSTLLKKTMGVLTIYSIGLSDFIQTTVTGKDVHERASNIYGYK